MIKKILLCCIFSSGLLMADERDWIQLRAKLSRPEMVGQDLASKKKIEKYGVAGFQGMCGDYYVVYRKKGMKGNLRQATGEYSVKIGVEEAPIPYYDLVKEALNIPYAFVEEGQIPYFVIEQIEMDQEDHYFSMRYEGSFPEGKKCEVHTDHFQMKFHLVDHRNSHLVLTPAEEKLFHTQEHPWEVSIPYIYGSILAKLSLIREDYTHFLIQKAESLDRQKRFVMEFPGTLPEGGKKVSVIADNLMFDMVLYKEKSHELAMEIDQSQIIAHHPTN